ncbi:hypothetical protein H9Q69_003138 [Fusarium xylarioides]|uniref:Stc1 domain-containing protein n=1 Tax=Fusarium xylarioides TaxID=221167 RepID=A0A9P7HLM2_9HYPO|nr:hypothetical protein H9Q70_009803 [Fusarium xylarioides]KAG5762150.1 hypothetical protein H9Q72_009754 [Fusarium xylarioides]KAG5776481.1 hypothetical protein H9Q73_009861 [Fusarium xylarioides]KAG5797833.1 hypothetical protein H9Q69_003138 [Fusarium xylarioides]KAG5803592.1 hypothetical protein H9Q71_011826 [Fusarium xylarioides]
MSNSNKGGYKPFRCAAGNEWKPWDMFSKAQQRNTRFLIDSNRKVDPENTGMICKEHNSTPVLEHGCVGCNRRLPYAAFSLNQRRLEDWRCIQCVAWDTVAEPSVTPIPKATGHISVEEEEMMSRGYLAPIEVAQFFEEDDLPGAPITSPESLGLDPNNEDDNKVFNEVVRGSSQAIHSSTTRTYASTTSSVAGDNMSTTSSRATLPPHLHNLLPERLTSMSIGEGSVSSNPKVVLPQVSQKASDLPPHLRGVKIAQRTATSSITGSVSTATTLRKDKEEEAAARKITFNAWDPMGQRHTASKNPTVMSSSASEVSTTEDSDQGAKLTDGWDDIPPMKEVSTRREDRWGYGKENRLTQTSNKWQKKNDRYFTQPNIMDQAEGSSGRKRSSHSTQSRNKFDALSN